MKNDMQMRSSSECIGAADTTKSEICLGFSGPKFTATIKLLLKDIRTIIFERIHDWHENKF